MNEKEQECANNILRRNTELEEINSELKVENNKLRVDNKKLEVENSVLETIIIEILKDRYIRRKGE